MMTVRNGSRYESVQGYTKQKHLDLIALKKLISFQLVFNLLIPLFALPLFSAHPATHLDDLSSGSRWQKVDGKASDPMEAVSMCPST